MQSEIDATIEKKKAEIILEGKKEKYKKATEEEGKAVENLKEAHDKLGISIEEARKKREELNNKMKELEKEGNIYRRISWFRKRKTKFGQFNKSI